MLPINLSSLVYSKCVVRFDVELPSYQIGYWNCTKSTANRTKLHKKKVLNSTQILFNPKKPLNQCMAIDAQMNFASH